MSKPTPFMTAPQVFQAMENLSEDGKYLFADILCGENGPDSEWVEHEAFPELVEVGLVHDGQDGDGDLRVYLGRE